MVLSILLIVMESSELGVLIYNLKEGLNLVRLVDYIMTFTNIVTRIRVVVTRGR